MAAYFSALNAEAAVFRPHDHIILTYRDLLNLINVLKLHRGTRRDPDPFLHNNLIDLVRNSFAPAGGLFVSD